MATQKRNDCTNPECPKHLSTVRHLINQANGIHSSLKTLLNALLSCGIVLAAPSVLPRDSGKVIQHSLSMQMGLTEYNARNIWPMMRASLGEASVCQL
ncbi:hypothetical protein IL306_012622 [Fusarium sp. DS 682]|nr:hypothetical protein IL306_012622 [Fusarium sp. DS 682]